MSENVVINGVECTPFDRQKAAAGHPVISRSGRKLLDQYFFNTVDGQQLYGPLEGDAYPRRWTVDGHYFLDGTESEYDLFMLTETRTMYCSVYLEGDRYITGNTLYDTPEKARFGSTDDSVVGEVTFPV
ncbi:hypothetical protein [Chitinophaga varians]|uniref:hypothetical protein n=1 Tax=Chitinophaga varians TaxID=2202339 RepID=UPI00165F1972|nr:hypothetical protein [Chitinophaga varians]MBC9913157.1 hypothetical protein [Chitinophaga varians]